MERTAVQGLQPLIAFAETAKHGSFARAAREQGVVPSTLAKAVARLEVSLGVKLFHRTTRQVTLTPDGERLYERCRRVLAELDDLQAEATGALLAPSGLLRVEASVFYGRHFVLPVLMDLVRQHPGLRLDLRLSDQKTDLVRDGIDLAVRIGELADSSLVAQRLDWQQLVVCASPAYLQARGTPRSLRDLDRHAVIVHRLPSTGRDRPWMFRQRGQDVTLSPAWRLRISETEGLVEAMTQGFGLCQVPDMVVRQELRRGELVEVLSNHRPRPMPISIVYPSGRLLPARVKAAIQALQVLRERNVNGD